MHQVILYLRRFRLNWEIIKKVMLKIIKKDKKVKAQF